jgi:endonuclease/exonuclease/phosphatase family metal-dependent hydrolase
MDRRLARRAGGGFTDRRAVVVSALRVMTWNIHGALGRNPRFDLALVVEFVRRHAPDIVALQEIDSRRARDGHAGNPFEVLRHALGIHGTDAHAISTADGDYGQALFSRWPLVSSSVHDLSFPEREPRRAICGDVATPWGPLRVIATHLGLSFRERRGQARTLLRLLGSARGATVALGDFNDWLWAGSVRRSLERALIGCTHHRTFPARLPLFQLDRIYVSPPARLLASHVDRRARDLSDHLPVIADIAL